MTKEKLKFIVKRKFSLLFESLSSLGQGNPKFYPRFLVKDALKSRLLFDGKVYWSEKELAAVGSRLIKKAKKNPQFLKKIALLCYKEGEELIATSEKIKKMELVGLSNNSLIRLFTRFALDTMRVIKFLHLPLAFEDYLTHSLEDILTAKIPRWALREKYFKILTFPIKQNEVVIAEKELLKIALAIKNNKAWLVLFKKNFKSFKKSLKLHPELKKKLQDHLEQFAWLTCPYYIGKPMGYLELGQKIRSLLETDIKKELTVLTNTPSKIESKTKQIIKNYHLNSQEQKLIWLAKEFVYLRTYRTDIYHQSGYNVRELLKEIGKRTGYTYNDLIYLTFPEIKSIFQKKVLKSVIKTRQKNYAIYSHRGKFTIYTGKRINKIKNKFEIESDLNTESIKELKGQSAYGGRIKGVVRIVLSSPQINKVRKGNILVTSMTSPVFMPALKKASACITDEGGILCHAAIVSRELKIPCIIGTKIATKVLKDGDKVEVDATKGIVKKI